MPELPEVETVRNTLKNYLIERKIIKIITPYPNIIKVDVETFKEKLQNQTFTDIKRYGKYLVFEFNDYTLVSHLRMEGKYFLRTSPKEFTKHEHVIFQLDNGLYLSYHDVRKFGTMELSKIGEEFNLESLSKLGVEVNAENIDIKKIFDLTKKSKRPIKAVLLDQTIITGLGNIYVDDSLAKSMINPNRPANSLTDQEIEQLVRAMREVLNKAIQYGGSTIKSFETIYGKGSMQEHLIVYGQTGKPCFRCGTPIEKIRIAGRGTHFCPNCQKL